MVTREGTPTVRFTLAGYNGHPHCPRGRMALVDHFLLCQVASTRDPLMSFPEGGFPDWGSERLNFQHKIGDLG